MLIEAATTRLAIDLIESLRKYKLTASNIKVSYIKKSGGTHFETFANLDELVTYYTTTFGRLIAARKDPFTTDRNKAQLTPLVKNGFIIGNMAQPVNDSKIDGFCSLGDFLSVESFILESSAFNYDTSYKCTDVSAKFNVTNGRKVDLRRNNTRIDNTDRHQAVIENLIKEYQLILKRLYNAYNASLYVDLCYVEIGYVQESILLYSSYFAMVKERIDTGLRLSVLEPRYLKKI
jgi:hypothetical protein